MMMMTVRTGRRATAVVLVATLAMMLAQGALASVDLDATEGSANDMVDDDESTELSNEYKDEHLLRADANKELNDWTHPMMKQVLPVLEWAAKQQQINMANNGIDIMDKNAPRESLPSNSNSSNEGGDENEKQVVDSTAAGSSNGLTAQEDEDLRKAEAQEEENRKLTNGETTRAVIKHDYVDQYGDIIEGPGYVALDSQMKSDKPAAKPVYVLENGQPLGSGPVVAGSSVAAHVASSVHTLPSNQPVVTATAGGHAGSASHSKSKGKSTSHAQAKSPQQLMHEAKTKKKPATTTKKKKKKKKLPVTKPAGLTLSSTSSASSAAASPTTTTAAAQ